MLGPLFDGLMKASIRVLLLAMCLVALGRFESAAGEAAKVIELWPAGAPGTNANLAAESDTTKPRITSSQANGSSAWATSPNRP